MTFLLAGGGGLLSFNTGFALWILISMIIFLLVMMKYAVTPIMKSLNEREAKIKDSLESAEKALARAEEISKDNEKALREAENKLSKFAKRHLKKQNFFEPSEFQKLRTRQHKSLSRLKTLLSKKRSKLSLN